MADEETLNIRLRIVNEAEVANQLDDITRDRAVPRTGGGSAAPGGGAGTGGGGANALATGASTAVFNRLFDAIRSLETSIGSAFDASTSAAEKTATVLEGLGNTISPAIGAAIKAVLGPQVETEQQTISRVLSQLQQAAEAIALAQGSGADPSSIKAAINERLGAQINALSDIERRRAQGSVALQQILADRSRGIDVGDAAQQAVEQVGTVGAQAGNQIPGLGLLLEALGITTEKQEEAAEKQIEAADVLKEAGKGLLAGGVVGAGVNVARTQLGNDGED